MTIPATTTPPIATRARQRADELAAQLTAAIEQLERAREQALAAPAGAELVARHAQIDQLAARVAELREHVSNASATASKLERRAARKCRQQARAAQPDRH